jgi:hypothetical protein
MHKLLKKAVLGSATQLKEVRDGRYDFEADLGKRSGRERISPGGTGGH